MRCTVNTIGITEHFVSRPETDGCEGCAGHYKNTNGDPTLCKALGDCPNIIWIKDEEA
jgi:hypothetical protein